MKQTIKGVVIGVLIALSATVGAQSPLAPKLPAYVLPASAVNGGGVVTSSQLLAPDGSAAAPSYSFASETDFGFYRSGTRSMHLVGATGTHLVSLGSSIAIKSDGEFRWSSTGQSNGTADLVLARDAANTLALRNGTAAQNLRIGPAAQYLNITKNTTTGAAEVYTANASPLQFGVNAGLQWGISTAGHWLALTDNTYDIGASGATRPRNVYIGSLLTVGSGISAGDNIETAAGTAFLWTGRSRMNATGGDGTILMTNAAQTGFTRLILGTNDASGIAIVKNGTTTQFMTGDGSSYSPVIAQSFYAASSGGYFTSSTATGTLVTNDAQTMADTAVLTLANSLKGFYIISEANNSWNAIIEVRGSSAAEVTDLQNKFSTTVGTASSINLYYDVNTFKLQNLTGGSIAVRMIRLGS